MSDFLLKFGVSSEDRRLVREFTRCESLNTESSLTQKHFSWGTVVVRKPDEDYLRPAVADCEFYAAVGRPILRRQPPATAVCPAARQAFERSSHPVAFLDRLSGIFALVIAGDDEVRVVTDPLGTLPVYAALGPDAQLVVGTQPEAVARLANLEECFDCVSLAQLVLEDRTTFPYTTRKGMLELAPGAVHRLRRKRSSPSAVLDGIDTSHYWLPLESSSPPPLSSMQDALFEACLQAAREIPQHNHQISLFASGGTDTRAMLGALGHNDRLDVEALTMADHENRELAIARRIAQKAAVPHRILWRYPDYYALILEAASDILGFEHSSQHAHMYGMLSDIAKDSLVVCGTGADTLLKCEYRSELPLALFTQRVLHGTRTPEVLSPRDFEQQLRSRTKMPVTRHIMEQIAHRKWEHYQQIKELRPHSAAEWALIYPGSRRRAIASSLCNTKMRRADEFFLHRSIVDVAIQVGVWDKISRRLTTPVYRRLAPELMSISDANSGLSARTPWFVRDLYTLIKAAARKGIRPVETVFNRLAGSTDKSPSMNSKPSWYTSGSWIDHGALYRDSQRWKEKVHQLSSAPAQHLAQRFLRNSFGLTSLINDDTYGAEPRYTLAQVGLLGHKTSHSNPND